MNKCFLVLLFCCSLIVEVRAQAGRVPDYSVDSFKIINLQQDTIPPRMRASLTLRALKNGYVIVRLKKNQKSIDAYRNAGKNDVADRIEYDRFKQNQKIYSAFTENFVFCPVYFIYADETADALAGKKGVFLNSNLEHDPGIQPTGDTFVFCEYGIAEQYSDFTDNGTGYNVYADTRSRSILDTIPTKKTTSPATFNGMFFSDKNLNQLSRPFPYVQDVYLDTYGRTARTLSREMENSYYRLVAGADFKEMRKKDRKKTGN